MRRRVVFSSMVAVCAIVPFTLVSNAQTTTSTTQTRTCPFPVVGGDPDTVTLNGPTTTPVVGQPVTFTVIANESPGEASHVVTLQVSVSSSDGGQSSTDPSNGVNTGFSPTTITLTLDQGHTYTIDWNADFDFGIHPCSSAQPDQSPFTLTT